MSQWIPVYRFGRDGLRCKGVASHEAGEHQQTSTKRSGHSAEDDISTFRANTVRLSRSGSIAAVVPNFTNDEDRNLLAIL